MMKHAFLLLACGLVSACGGGQRRPPNDEVTAQMTSDDEAAMDRGDRDPTQAGSAAIDRCVATLDDAVSGSTETDARAAANACAELFDRPVCRSAHQRAADLPIDAFVAAVFEDCAREYCPLFAAAQRHAACDSAASPDASLALSAWRELRASIWDLERDR